MSSKTTNTPVSSRENLQLATVEDRVAIQPTTSVPEFERVVVTRQQLGEIKLRYSPMETRRPSGGQTAAQE